MTEHVTTVDRMVIQYGFVIRILTTPVSIVVCEDTWLETASIMAEDEVAIGEEAEAMVEGAEVEDELALEEREMEMPNWLRRRRKKKIPQWQMVRWAKPISESRLRGCLWMLTLITELSLLVGSTT